MVGSAWGIPTQHKAGAALSWCHANPAFKYPEGPNNRPIVCLPPGEWPPNLRRVGVPPEGPYLGRSPPTGQPPQRGPNAYPRNRVICQFTGPPPTAEQSKRMDADQYYCPQNDTPVPANDGSSPYGSFANPLTPLPETPKPLKLKYPWILGKPGWIDSGRIGIHAYRFDDGHVYEFKTTVEGHDGYVLQTSPPPKLLRQGISITGQAGYMNRNKFLVYLSGDFIE